jgi:two-component system, NtrC family, nitrogen regulation sensor histidine kinase NtrY
MKDTRTDLIFGILGPESIHKNWQFLAREVEGVQPGIELIKLSYYVMLGVVTLLVVFSATWLGFTVAREITIPIQVLAEASASVARGSYDVRIDDIVSDDELGSLARSFRAMVVDLRLAHENEKTAAKLLTQKADELYEKTLYNDVLLRDINAAVLILDESGVIESWNQEAAWLFETPEYAAVGLHMERILPQNFVRPFLMELSSKLINAKEDRAQGEYVGKLLGNDVHLQVAISLVKSPKGGENRVVFVNDFTEIAKAQRIAAWRDVARKIAHEIKNPLTPIRLGAQRLENKFLNRFKEVSDFKAFKECIDVIIHSSDSIKSLVNEFLQFSRMPTAQLTAGSLIEAVSIAVASFRESPENAEVTLEVDKLFLASRDVYFDKNQIVRLCTNLISNGVAACAGQNMRRVEVTIKRHEQNEFAQIEFRDTGVGVPESMRDKIFEPYFSTKRSGMGLGLVIVQQIVSDHGGKLSIEPNSPQGTVVTFEFPMQPNELRTL